MDYIKLFFTYKNPVKVITNKEDILKRFIEYDRDRQIKCKPSRDSNRRRKILLLKSGHGISLDMAKSQ